MKLCIPVRGPGGLESVIEPHLPHAQNLLFFDTETRHCEEISLRDQPAGAADNIQIHAVLCGSINRITLRALTDQGIKVYGTEAATAGQAIAQYERGELDVASGNCGHEHAPGTHHGAGGEGRGGCCGSHGEAHGHGDAGCCGGQGHAEGDHHCHSEGAGCGGHGHAHEGGAGGCCASDGLHESTAAQRIPGDTFKIAVCSQNRKTVTDHAGKCRKFWIYDVKHGQVVGRSLLELAIEKSFHENAAWTSPCAG